MLHNILCTLVYGQYKCSLSRFPVDFVNENLHFISIFAATLGGNVGLAVTQIFNLIIMCQWGMRQTAELENQMTSVERVIEYTDLKSEPSLESLEKYRPPEKWPERGTIHFNGLSMKYSENSNNVLKEVTLRIESKEKIGVVGRTGAGKSSIIQALFRLAVNDGVVTIDGIDIASMGLHDLRSKISIIPQDPILFSGNMRNNLDPFEEKTDDEIWNALAQVRISSLNFNRDSIADKTKLIVLSTGGIEASG